MSQNSKPTILIVDNQSPYTKDIVKCIRKLGVRYTIKNWQSLFNASFSNEDSKLDSKSRESYIHEESNGRLLSGHLVNTPRQRLGTELNSNSGGSSTIGYAGITHDNGKSFFDKVILSGRKANEPKINAINSQIIRQCLLGNIPLLGICYGAEILALTLGGSIKKMSRSIHENIPITISKSSPLISKDSTPIFYESHKYCISRLPEGFEPLASSSYCKYEIFSFRTLFGTQFHPEKSGIDGFNLLSNFVSM